MNDVPRYKETHSQTIGCSENLSKREHDKLSNNPGHTICFFVRLLERGARGKECIRDVTTLRTRKRANFPKHISVEIHDETIFYESYPPLTIRSCLT